MSVQFDFLSVLSEWPILLRGILWTIGLTTISSVLGVFSGLAFAWLRTRNKLFLNGVIKIYVELIRNTPFIVQLFFVFLAYHNSVLGLALRSRPF